MAQRISGFKKGLVLAAAAVITIGGAGAAFAYWTSTGVGDGEATTGEQVATFGITAVQGTGVISPDGLGRTVVFTVTNPGPGTLYLGDVTVSIADENGDEWIPADDSETDSVCLSEDYEVAMTIPVTAGDLAAGASRDGTVTVTLNNTDENQDDCQGQDVPLHFVAGSTVAP